MRTPSGKPRARALGIAFEGEPGAKNAITDVPGVSVGFTTLISGSGPLQVGKGPVRTGVTAILPRPTADVLHPVFAGLFSLNGIGELSGAHLIGELGQLVGPITITNTHSCGLARDATIDWVNMRFPDAYLNDFGLPVAAETYDGFLNDINGFHVRREHVFEAIESAQDGPIEEGSVGGGTGMKCFEFKAGSGSASRLVVHDGTTYVVGIFVQANFGDRRDLIVRGHCVGVRLKEPTMRECSPRAEKSSIVGVVATDAPLLPHQVTRLARRAPLGMAKTGGLARHSSGDLFLAFSTANADSLRQGERALSCTHFIPDACLDPLFEAVVQGTEEAILNSLACNEAMEGRDGNSVPALPGEALQTIVNASSID